MCLNNSQGKLVKINNKKKTSIAAQTDILKTMLKSFLFTNVSNSFSIAISSMNLDIYVFKRLKIKFH